MSEAMKGVVFTELLDWIERHHGVVALDEILLDADLPHGGAYTVAGAYDRTELVAIVTSTARFLAADFDGAMCDFGRHLFGVLAQRYPDALADAGDAFACLARVEGCVCAETAKGAEQPWFHVAASERQVVLECAAPRATVALARGLIEGCLGHYGTQAAIEQSTADRRHRFVIERKEAACPATR